MRTEVIKIEDQNIVDELEMLSIEVNSRKELLSFMIQNDSYVVAKDSFDNYHKEYQKIYTKYNNLKRELANAYIIKRFGDKAIDWSLDFGSGELTVNISD